MKNNVITPPTSLERFISRILRSNHIENPSILLAGSIEMGLAENWQDKLIKELEVMNTSDTPITIFNPRRSDGDSSWKNDLTDTRFVEQVTWEITAIEAANLIVVYFDPTTKSPISLFELGLTLGNCTNVIVCCPDGFWRKGNIQVYAKLFPYMTLVDTWEQFVDKIKLSV